MLYEVITIFAGDTRITTNVLRSDGSRAVGTRLDAGPIHEKVLTEGKPYRGEASIRITSYNVCYTKLLRTCSVRRVRERMPTMCASEIASRRATPSSAPG